jgi:hypothetical protein
MYVRKGCSLCVSEDWLVEGREGPLSPHKGQRLESVRGGGRRQVER